MLGMFRLRSGFFGFGRDHILGDQDGLNCRFVQFAGLKHSRLPTP